MRQTRKKGVLPIAAFACGIIKPGQTKPGKPAELAGRVQGLGHPAINAKVEGARGMSARDEVIDCSAEEGQFLCIQR
ncbi:MAG: hypothetical protein COS39_01470 [Hydrogenophilales bacterium CG03_land_8_20_14_0_80_62_28]|nr:MAG: hypothetical protein AUJ86_00780 [Hydrogenophilaceae bacterium CG1_02_62_390]PIV24344.1 MAG: hypothetical protein COS39_01470 [Hydrogenophilales bacterium CG03_land_8_20_14_0_80_62_28]PIW71887.1 MAG: hypothetical protein COW07_06010 [Hydrogenophilales bacterium CG12_big_fil_rev_8_21_14_0_65_61_21]PIX00940.1 MAG: hypothetical protein COZ79_09630 [Hydrogenophilales bacterium CG_4_8_14_3_um_filter_62_83]PIY97819.1 MAG: hypothetical protein COY64_09200 [Hydrogenophilales bacterium CG_4_10_1